MISAITDIYNCVWPYKCTPLASSLPLCYRDEAAAIFLNYMPIFAPLARLLRDLLHADAGIDSAPTCRQVISLLMSNPLNTERRTPTHFRPYNAST